MGQYDFTYDIPNNFSGEAARFFSQNNDLLLAQHIRSCDIDYNNLGYAHYAGISGDTWNKEALDLTIIGRKIDIDYLQSRKKDLKEKLQKVLRPSVSGLLIRNIDFIVNEGTAVVDLPQQSEESFEVLSQDIQDAIAKDEPSLVLNRLHTFSTKYLRKICDRHGIQISDGGDYYPLQSLMGSLVKHYERNGSFQSAFSTQALKMSISTFDKYNAIRNDQSYAHDNTVLNKAEAIYVIEIVTATLRLVNFVEDEIL